MKWTPLYCAAPMGEFEGLLLGENLAKRIREAPFANHFAELAELATASFAHAVSSRRAMAAWRPSILNLSLPRA